MKLFNLLLLAIASITTVFAAADYEITHYGCPDECNTQEHGACHVPTYPLDHKGTKFFCAISTKLSHYKDYCGKYVVLMLTDGSKKMINVQIADTCGNCDKYHIDLSTYSFTELLSKGKGEAEVVYGIYSESGSVLLGPIYRHLPNSKFGLSEDAFISAFNANAKKLVKNYSNTGEFNGSASEVTTTTTTTTTTLATTTQGTLATPTLLNNGTIVPPNNETITPTTKSVPKKPEEKKPVQTTVSEAVKEKVDDDESTPTVGIITALSGTVLGAAGIGLLVMKKRSPGTYEDMKQKFPEAFSQVKRGLTRRATSLKRRVTRKVPAPPVPSPVPTNDNGVSSV